MPGDKPVNHFAKLFNRVGVFFGLSGSVIGAGNFKQNLNLILAAADFGLGVFAVHFVSFRFISGVIAFDALTLANLPVL